MLPDFFTHHPWPAIVGGLGLAVVWGAVKKRNDARIIFLFISYECTKRKKERKKKGCAYKKLLHPSIIVRIDSSIRISARKERTSSSE